MLDKMNVRKIWLSEIGVFCILFFLTFIFLIQSPLNILLPDGYSSTDSSVFKTVALCMENGLMPYKDSFDHKGPLLYIYNWMGMQIAYWRGIWAIEFISLFVCFIFMYKTARLRCGRFFSLIVVLICVAPLYMYFEEGNLTEEYALPFISCSLFVFADYFMNTRISKGRLMMCGFSFGAVCLLRINMIAVWVTFCIAVFIQCLYKEEIKKVMFFLLYFVIGTAVIVVPILLWLMVNGAFADFINDYFIFNSMYIDEKNTASLLNKYNSFSYFLNNFYIILAIVVSSCMCKDKKIFHIFYLAYIFITLIFICLSGRKYLHYGMVLVPALVYPVSWMLSKTTEGKKNEILGFVLYLMVVQVIPTWISGINRIAGYCLQKENVSAEMTLEEKVIEYVVSNSTENDRIVVWGNWDIIYVLSRRLPASKYSYQFPIVDFDKTILSDFFGELKENPPKLIIDKQGGGMEQFMEDNGYVCTIDISGIKIYMKN